MIILAIETSCDDTSVSLIKISGKKNPAFKILSNVISSQVEIHKKWGGVYPTLAKREHQKNITPVLIKSLSEARMLKRIKNSRRENMATPPNGQKLKTILEREETLFEQLKAFLEKYEKPNIDLISVTTGPGLEPCLWVGVNFAKVLAYSWDLPIVPVNHVEAHILANWLGPIRKNSRDIFPAVCLVVSGGHTQLILMKFFKKYKIIGETRDDAAGECFDKAAKIMGLGYPGGPVIAALAKIYGGRTSEKLPRPMINQKNYDFSFSGLKTAVLYNYKNQPLRVRKSKKYIQTMCAEVQQAIIDVLIRKTIKAAKDFGAKTIILGGGVTANKELRKRFKAACLKPGFQLLVPPSSLSTDNAAMAGAAAYFNRNKKTNWQNIEAEANLRI